MSNVDVSGGYVVLPPDIVDSPVWANSRLLHVWTYLLMKARHNDGYVMIGRGDDEQVVKLKSGQLIFNRRAAGEVLGMKPDELELQMAELVRIEMVERKVTDDYAVVTVCNYSRYRGTEDKSGLQ